MYVCLCLNAETSNVRSVFSLLLLSLRSIEEKLLVNLLSSVNRKIPLWQTARKTISSIDTCGICNERKSHNYTFLFNVSIFIIIISYLTKFFLLLLHHLLHLLSKSVFSIRTRWTKGNDDWIWNHDKKDKYWFNIYNDSIVFFKNHEKKRKDKIKFVEYIVELTWCQMKRKSSSLVWSKERNFQYPITFLVWVYQLNSRAKLSFFLSLALSFSPTEPLNNIFLVWSEQCHYSSFFLLHSLKRESKKRRRRKEFCRRCLFSFDVFCLWVCAKAKVLIHAQIDSFFSTFYDTNNDLLCGNEMILSFFLFKTKQENCSMFFFFFFVTTKNHDFLRFSFCLSRKR